LLKITRVEEGWLGNERATDA